MKRSGVRPSVFLPHRSTAAAAGLLITAPRAGHRSTVAGAAAEQPGLQQQMRAVSR